jgi:MFS family permease
MRHHFNSAHFRIKGEKLPGSIKIVLAAVFVYSLGWGVIGPYIPLYIKSIVNNYALIGLIFGLVNLVIFFFSAPIGDLADKVRPKKLIAVSLLAYPFIGAGYAFATNFWQLVVTRTIHGVFNPGYWVPTEAFIRKNTNKKNNLKAFGWYSTISSLAVVIGAFIGAFLILFITPNQMYLLIIPCSLIALLIMLKIKEKNAKEETVKEGILEVIEKDGIVKKEVKDFFKLGRTGLVLATLVFFSSFISYIIYFVIPLISEEISINLTGLGLLYGAVQIPFIFCFLLAGLAGREGKMRIIQIGFLLMAIDLAILFLGAGIINLFVVCCIALAFLIALVSPSISSIITDITPKKEMGEITGVYYAMSFLGGTAGPIAFGIIGDLWGLKTIFIITAAIAFIIFLLAFAVRKKVTE